MESHSKFPSVPNHHQPVMISWGFQPPKGDPSGASMFFWCNKEALKKHPFSSLYPPLSHGKCMNMSGLNRSTCRMFVDKPMDKAINKMNY